jgi:hypothetical protein
MSSPSDEKSDHEDTRGPSVEESQGFEISRLEELETLKHIYYTDEIEFLREGEDLIYQIRKVLLRVVTMPGYPDNLPHITTCDQSEEESIKLIDDLNSLAELRKGSVMVYDLISDSQAIEPTPTRKIRSQSSSSHEDAQEYMESVALESIQTSFGQKIASRTGAPFACRVGHEFPLWQSSFDRKDQSCAVILNWNHYEEIGRTWKVPY